MQLMDGYRRSLCALVLGLLVVAAPACKQKSNDTAAAAPDTSMAAPAPAPAAFAVQGVEVGKQIGADKRVSSPSTTFAPKDTIYASVATEGAAPSKTIAAKWTFGSGKLVKADSQTIAPSGPEATEFHIAKPSGWPVGKYKVEISVDGSPAGSKEFEVKK
jgi:hypothetical protein